MSAWKPHWQWASGGKRKGLALPFTPHLLPITLDGDFPLTTPDGSAGAEGNRRARGQLMRAATLLGNSAPEGLQGCTQCKSHFSSGQEG